MTNSNVFIGIGGNLPSARFGPPLSVLTAAVDALGPAGITVARRSRWYRSAPLPPSDQPAFVNGVVAVTTALDSSAALAALHAIEASFGRVRGEVNAARILDLDLLAWGQRVVQGARGLWLPHPRMHLRAFVLVPMADIAAGWRHPLLGQSVQELLRALPPGQLVEPLAEEDGKSLLRSLSGADRTP